MNKKVLTLVLFFILIMSACNVPEKVTKDMAATFAASTIEAELNYIGSLTPPIPTATETVPPTETPIPSDTPTPTIAATPTWTYHEAGQAEILILYYNDVVNDRNEDPYYQWEFDYLYVPSIEFEQQVRILSELNYTSITLSDMVKVLRSGGELPERPVMFTFDSTEMGQWINAYPILKKYGMVGNLLIMANHVDAKNSLSSDQIKEMLADGWDIGSSGYYGNGMTGTGTYGEEIGQSKVKLQEIFDRDITVFAYPDGYTDPEGEMIRRVINYGYQAALAGNLRSIELSTNNIYYLPRFEIHKGMSYNEFFSILPWKEGYISPETMEWAMPTPTIDPAILEVTKSAQETMIAAEAAAYGN